MDSLAALFAAAPGGDPGWAVRSALVRAYGVRADGEAVAGWQALAVWATVLLLRELPARADAVGDWADRLGPTLYWPQAADAVAGPGPAPALTVTAGRFVAVSGEAGAFDLEARADVPAVPADWLECRVFNLRTLFRACSDRAQGEQPSPTQPPRPSGPTPTPPPPAS